MSRISFFFPYRQSISTILICIFQNESLGDIQKIVPARRKGEGARSLWNELAEATDDPAAMPASSPTADAATVDPPSGRAPVAPGGSEGASSGAEG